MNSLKLGKVFLWAALILMVFFALLGESKGSDLLSLLGLVSAAIGIIAWILLGRCPECGRFLGRAGSAHCPHCGAELKWQ